MAFSGQAGTHSPQPSQALMSIPNRSSSITHASSGQASAQARQLASLMWLCTQRSAMTVGSRASAAVVTRVCGGMGVVVCITGRVAGRRDCGTGSRFLWGGVGGFITRKEPVTLILRCLPVHCPSYCKFLPYSRTPARSGSQCTWDLDCSGCCAQRRLARSTKNGCSGRQQFGRVLHALLDFHMERHCMSFVLTLCILSNGESKTYSDTSCVCHSKCRRCCEPPSGYSYLA